MSQEEEGAKSPIDKNSTEETLDRQSGVHDETPPSKDGRVLRPDSDSELVDRANLNAPARQQKSPDGVLPSVAGTEGSHMKHPKVKPQASNSSIRQHGESPDQSGKLHTSGSVTPTGEGHNVSNGKGRAHDPRSANPGVSSENPGNEGEHHARKKHHHLTPIGMGIGLAEKAGHAAASEVKKVGKEAKSIASTKQKHVESASKMTQDSKTSPMFAKGAGAGITRPDAGESESGGILSRTGSTKKTGRSFAFSIKPKEKAEAKGSAESESNFVSKIKKHKKVTAALVLSFAIPLLASPALLTTVDSYEEPPPANACGAGTDDTEAVNAAASTGDFAGAVRAPFVGTYTTTSPFGQRVNPGGILRGQLRLHDGVDLAGPDKHIVSATWGKVVDVKLDPLSGNSVYVDAGGGVKLGYFHLAQASKLKVGDEVWPGRYIGVEGATGNVSGVHLHFQVHINDKPTDPIPWMKSHGVNIAPVGGTTSGGAVVDTKPEKPSASSSASGSSKPSSSSVKAFKPNLDSRPGTSYYAAIAKTNGKSSPIQGQVVYQNVANFKMKPADGEPAAGWSVDKGEINLDSVKFDSSGKSNLNVIKSPASWKSPTGEMITKAQLNNAYMIMGLVKRVLPSDISSDPVKLAKAQAVTLTTAFQESRWLNLQGGDRDSIGFYQQRPSQEWGSPSQIRDPLFATKSFVGVNSAVPKYNLGILKVKGWESMDTTVLAQKIQNSGFPEAYRPQERISTAFMKNVGVTANISGSTASAGATEIGDTCDGDDSAADSGTPGSATLRNVPESEYGNAIIKAAETQKGLPYVWGGGASPTPPKPDLGVPYPGRGRSTVPGLDCSGLVRYAYYYGTGGYYNLPAGTSAQKPDPRTNTVGIVYNADSKAGLLKIMKPGDMVLMDFKNTGNHAWGHTTLYAGNGRIIHASNFGTPLGYAPLTGHFEKFSWHAKRPFTGDQNKGDTGGGPNIKPGAKK